MPFVRSMAVGGLKQKMCLKRSPSKRITKSSGANIINQKLAATDADIDEDTEGVEEVDVCGEAAICE